MAFRKLNGIKEHILQAVLEIGGEEGLHSVTARKVADKCGISDFTVFNYYKSIRNLLMSAAKYFDMLMLKVIADAVTSGMDHQYIWDTILDSLVFEKHGTLYYSNYINQFGYDFTPDTPDGPRASDFLQIAKLLYQQEKNDLTEKHLLFMFDFVATMALYYAAKIIKGQMEDSSEFRNYTKEIVFYGSENFAKR